MTDTRTLIQTSGPIKPPEGTKPTLSPYFAAMRAICEPYGIPGRDHASTLVYLQTVTVNFAGIVKDDFHGQRMSDRRRPGWQPGYGVRYWDGSQDGEKDDWDCLWDLEDLGLIKTKGTGFNPVVFMTALGNEVACKINAYRQEVDLQRPRVITSAAEERRQKKIDDEKQAKELADGLARQEFLAIRRRRRKELKAKRDWEALNKRFAGSIEVMPDEMHPRGSRE
jgi:hypothetical protein